MSEDPAKYEVLYNHNTLLETREFKKDREFIFTVTAVPEKCKSACRCLGFFSTFSEALFYINKNGLNGMDEAGIFNYLVVEKFEDGLYATCEFLDQTWFKADYTNQSWQECKTPEEYKNLTNFGMG